MTQIQCPHCQHVFEPAIALPEGKRTKCPNCRKPFAAPSPAANRASSTGPKTGKPAAEHLIAEFRSIDGFPRSEGGTVAYGHVFPLARPPKGSKERADPVTPELDFDLYDKLPVEMRISSPTEEIRTVVLVDWWWNTHGEYENQLTGGRGRAYVGKCTITVIDRQTKKIIAETTLVSSQKPPPKKRTAMNWYGSQPSYEDVVKYLKTLPQQ